MNREILLQAQNVTRVFGQGERRFTALENINLDLYKGEFVALLGPSGCGKSTFLRMITGLIAPTSGGITYRGQPVRGVNPYATMVFQSFALYPWLSVLDNVALALEARGVPLQERRQKATALIDLVGLDGFESAYPRELSGGMRQKVGFARALAVEPELLCLDEPFSALDVLSAEALRGELMELWTGGVLPIQAVLMVSHNIEEALMMADRIVVMGKEPGHIVTEFEVALPHPRQRKSALFEAQVDRIYAAIAGHTQAEALEVGTAPGAPGSTRLLPRASAAELAGMLDHVAAADGHHDIYKLDNELNIEMSDLMQSIEMAEMLGFAQVEAGDIHLTPLGQTFAEASILTRKEIFANRARRLPMLEWVLQMLKSVPEQQLPYKVFFTALRPDFPDQLAEHQLDTAIDWGRYAELIHYNDTNEMLSVGSADQQILKSAV